jgi:hypothetical protein
MKYVTLNTKKVGAAVSIPATDKTPSMIRNIIHYVSILT